MDFMSKISRIFLLLLYFVSSAQSAPAIVDPKPVSLFGFENQKVQVTCVVEDTVSNPIEITFLRRTKFGDVTYIKDEGPNGRRYFQKQPLDGGRRLRVTLHIKKVIKTDDEQFGDYECIGRSAGGSDRYGFSINFVDLKELPEVHASGNVTTKIGKQIQLSCNVILNPLGAQRWQKFVKFTWIKDRSVVIKSSNSFPTSSSNQTLVLNVTSGDVGGTYTCNLVYMLRAYTRMSMSKTITVRVYEGCSLKPCKNGANCTAKIDDYECTCPPEYEGKNCTKESKLYEVHASGNVTAKFGDRIQLSCNVNVTDRGALLTTIGTFTWTKDKSVLIESSFSISSSNQTLVLNVSSGDVGGTYTCDLEYLLRKAIKRRLTKTITVKVQPQFFPEKKEEKNGTWLVCTAQGNPLVTEWKRKPYLLRDDIFVLDKKDNSSKGKYVFSNMDDFKDHSLTIYDVRSSDAGQYYCCIKNIMSPRPNEDLSNCQIFDVSPQPQRTASSSKLLAQVGSSVGKTSITLSIILLDLLLTWLLS